MFLLWFQKSICTCQGNHQILGSELLPLTWLIWAQRGRESQQKSISLFLLEGVCPGLLGALGVVHESVTCMHARELL